MFIHVGAITKSETPNQLIGVIAHEAGHIAGGHLARLRVQIGRMESAALIACLGLWIVKAIVERHGGTVRAARRDGGHIRFSVTLPIRGPAT